MYSTTPGPWRFIKSLIVNIKIGGRNKIVTTLSTVKFHLLLPIVNIRLFDRRYQNFPPLLLQKQTFKPQQVN